MSVKKAKKSPRTMQYLLNVDQKLQKISLKRISERLTRRRSRPVRAKHPAVARSGTHVSPPLNWRPIVIGVTCIVAAAALIAASQSSTSPDVANAADASVEITPLAKSVRPSAVQATPKPAAVVPTAKPAPVDAKPQPDVQDTAPITVTGCLERDGVTFWLKDTSGVPETSTKRSWKSGFLKKRSSRVGVVSATNAVKLPNYVGERVAATGAFMNGQMRARSLRRVAASCK